MSDIRNRIVLLAPTSHMPLAIRTLGSDNVTLQFHLWGGNPAAWSTTVAGSIVITRADLANLADAIRRPGPTTVGPFTLSRGVYNGRWSISVSWSGGGPFYIDDDVYGWSGGALEFPWVPSDADSVKYCGLDRYAYRVAVELTAAAAYSPSNPFANGLPIANLIAVVVSGQKVPTLLPLSPTGGSGYSIYFETWDGVIDSSWTESTSTSYVLTAAKVRELGAAIDTARTGGAVPISVVDGGTTVTVNRTTGGDGRAKVTVQFNADPAVQIDNDAAVPSIAPLAPYGYGAWANYVPYASAVATAFKAVA